MVAKTVSEMLTIWLLVILATVVTTAYYETFITVKTQTTIPDWSTRHYRGHMYTVLTYSNSKTFTHSPNCPCLTKKD